MCGTGEGVNERFSVKTSMKMRGVVVSLGMRKLQKEERSKTKQSLKRVRGSAWAKENTLLPVIKLKRKI